jgi:hypothetical protein
MVEKPKPNLDLCYPFSMFRLGFLFVTTMKDAYYFPHFCNARNDRKVKRVIKQHGIQGYGIYFMLLEVLREQTDYRYPFEDVDLLADEFGVEEQTLLSVINDSELFQIDGDSFYSINLIKYLEPMIRMREQRSKAGKASAAARFNTVTNDDPTELNDRSTVVERVLNENEQKKRKESKVKESKVNETILNESIEHSNAINPLLLDDDSVMRMFTEPEPKPDPPDTKYSDDFERVWEMYGRKGSKRQAYIEWIKLTPVDRKLTLTHIPAYVDNLKDEPQYMKDFERYLKHGTYHSTIIERPRKNYFSGSL